jgi:hypothetical protein
MQHLRTVGSWVPSVTHWILPSDELMLAMVVTRSIYKGKDSLIH